MTVPPAPMAAFSQEEIASPFRPSVLLDGTWNFQFADEAPQTIQVPAPWESQRHDLCNRAGTAVYERTFTLPESFAGQRALLRFGAVDYYTEVWVNNVLVGTHEGGYTPFQFFIEGALSEFDPQARHTLRVRVTDSTVRQDAILPT